MEIFDYFTGDEIYLLFSQLNIRLNLILKSLPNVIVTTQNRLESILTFFNSFKAISIPYYTEGLDFTYKEPQYVPNGHRLLYIYPSFDYQQFYGRFNKTDDIIRPNICSQLRSLSLPNSSAKLLELIFNGEFPRLEISHLGRCERFVFPLSSTIQLFGLSAGNQTFSKLENAVCLLKSIL
ncbi:unnamed protein product [Adineta steineri]|uniref:Uncharacterized protein n=1 Tax=Adineta steineri TaxID=433720 RepID=A0A814TD44_9BILA|nr:unnamed protein product [Adineta steineri]CAF1355994.1 unnamed protein product [Adineta steineri]